MHQPGTIYSKLVLRRQSVTNCANGHQERVVWLLPQRVQYAIDVEIFVNQSQTLLANLVLGAALRL